MNLKNLKVHHIGYLVKQLDKAIELFEIMGYSKIGDIVYDMYREIDIMFMEKDGYRVELVSPKTKSSVVSDLYTKIGNCPYHICYEVEDIKEAVSELRKQKFVLCSEIQSAVAFDEKPVVFLINGKIGMIELVSKYC